MARRGPFPLLWTKLSDFGTRVTGKSVPQAHVFVAGESIPCFDEVAQRFCLAHFVR
jgi:hypothetical protein